MPPRGRPLLVVLSLVASSSVASLSSASFCDAAAACRSLVLAVVAAVFFPASLMPGGYSLFDWQLLQLRLTRRARKRRPMSEEEEEVQDQKQTIDAKCKARTQRALP